MSEHQQQQRTESLLIFFNTAFKSVKANLNNITSLYNAELIWNILLEM